MAVAGESELCGLWFQFITQAQQVPVPRMPQPFINFNIQAFAPSPWQQGWWAESSAFEVVQDLENFLGSLSTANTHGHLHKETAT